MTMFRLASNELRRVTTGKLPLLAVIALVLVPLLYGAMYLFANWDPYGRLGDIPAAVVVQDKGGTGPDGKPLNAGNQVADQLTQTHTFDWHKVSAADANAGVASGKYTFAVTLPSDFTSALVSPANFQPRQGILNLTTNDANNYLVGTIADKVVESVRSAVSQKVGTTAAGHLLLGYANIHDQLTSSVGGAGKLADGANQANTGANQLATGAQQLDTSQHQLATGANTVSTQLGTLSSGLKTLQSKASGLPGQASQLATSAHKVSDGDAKIAGTADDVANASQQFVTNLDGMRSQIQQKLQNATTPSGEHLSPAQIQSVLSIVDSAKQPSTTANNTIQSGRGQLDQLAAPAKQVASGVDQLNTTAGQLSTGINQAATGAGQLNSGVTGLQTGEQTAVAGTDKLLTSATGLKTGTATLASNATKLRDGLRTGLGQIPDPNAATRDKTAQTIGDPLSVNTVGQAQASSYGAGLAPFFLGLATWIGAFVLFLLLRPLSSRALAAGTSAVRTALGGWLPSALLAIAQVLVLYLVVVFALGIHPVHRFLSFGLLVLAALTFTAIMHGLNAAFGVVGKFIGLVLLVLQLVSAGGTFPWQTIPAALYPFHVVLPMGYLVDGLRHLIYGGELSGVAIDAAVLVGWLIFGLALSVFAARKFRVWTPARLKPELAL